MQLEKWKDRIGGAPGEGDDEEDVTRKAGRDKVMLGLEGQHEHLRFLK